MNKMGRASNKDNLKHDDKLKLVNLIQNATSLIYQKLIQKEKVHLKAFVFCNHLYTLHSSVCLAVVCTPCIRLCVLQLYV
jgi:hypothetical protein